MVWPGWCAIFVCWCYDQAGTPLPNIGFKHGFAGCQSALTWFTEKKWITRFPVEGDIVLFDWQRDGRYDHAGLFVQHIEPGFFQSIEGNTAIGNNSNGGEVMLRKRRYVNAIFVHPVL